jgi:hypothetical protein
MDMHALWAALLSPSIVWGCVHFFLPSQWIACDIERARAAFWTEIWLQGTGTGSQHQERSKRRLVFESGDGKDLARGQERHRKRNSKFSTAISRLAFSERPLGIDMVLSRIRITAG